MTIQTAAIRSVKILAILFGLSSPVFGQAADSPQAMNPAVAGTPDQQAACRPDVRRFCRSIKPEDGVMGYLGCLKEHRAKLSTTCRTMLESNGQ